MSRSTEAALQGESMPTGIFDDRVVCVARPMDERALHAAELAERKRQEESR